MPVSRGVPYSEFTMAPIDGCDVVPARHAAPNHSQVFPGKDVCGETAESSSPECCCCDNNHDNDK